MGGGGEFRVLGFGFRVLTNKKLRVSKIGGFGFRV